MNIVTKVKNFIKNNKTLSIIFADILLLLIAIVLLIAPNKPTTTEGLKVADSDFESIELAWNQNSSADAYRVYRSKDAKDFEYLATTTDTKYKDDTVRTGDVYYYAVTARNGLKNSKIDKQHTIEASAQLESPTLKVDTKEGEMKLSYKPVDGAIGYEIARDGEVLDRIKETSFIDSEADSDKTHSYQVRAFRYKKNPVYSEASNKVEAELHGIQNFLIETDSKSLLFTWDPSDYYDTYKLYKDNELLSETKETKFSLEDYKMSEKMNIRLEGSNSEDGIKSPKKEHNIIVEEGEMNNKGAIDAACKWGVDIANDDSFTYGTGSRAHHNGCYFCGTNTGPRKSLKGKSKVNGHSYEKTYCCNPFVHACYAHGAGDEKMLKDCRSGDAIDMTERSYTRYGTFERVGKPAIPSLKKGDVLVASSHVMLYIGDGQIVHACRSGWDKASITTAKCSSYYGMVKFVMRYKGNGGGTTRIVKYLDEDGNEIETPETTEEE